MKKLTPQQKQALKKMIGQNIRNLSKELYGHRKDFLMAEALYISQGTLSDIMTGRSFPSCITIIKLAKLMEITSCEKSIKTIYDILEI